MAFICSFLHAKTSSFSVRFCTLQSLTSFVFNKSLSSFPRFLTSFLQIPFSPAPGVPTSLSWLSDLLRRTPAPLEITPARHCTGTPWRAPTHCTRKNQFVFSSFLHTAKSNILCFQQILQFVPTIFNIFSANPFLPCSWGPHFPVLAFGPCFGEHRLPKEPRPDLSFPRKRESIFVSSNDGPPPSRGRRT